MFEKKSIIFNENMGVCRVDDITGLSVQKLAPVSYYVLRSIYLKEKVAYIPVEHHTVQLRELITKEEAEEKIKAWKQQGVWLLQTDEDEQEGEQKQAVKEEDTISWRIQYEMADMLPQDQCRLLYEQGEADYVVKQELKKQVK